MEMFEKVLNECATKEGSSQADIDDTISHKPPNGKGGKCLRGKWKKIQNKIRIYQFV